MRSGSTLIIEDSTVLVKFALNLGHLNRHQPQKWPDFELTLSSSPPIKFE
jgi:hypothetical protein